MIRLRVKEVAREQKMGRNQLSRRSDVHLSIVKRIWRDPFHNIQIETLNRLAYALQVDARELLDFTPDETPPWFGIPPNKVPDEDEGEDEDEDDG